MISCLRRLGLGFIFWAIATCAFSQAYPSKPVKVIVPYGSGTAIDVIVRQLNEVLAKAFEQPFITENRSGASGTIGTAAVATAAPDGYTILATASTHTSAPAYMPVPYDPLRDFAGVTTITDSPLVLVVAKSSGITSVKELVSAAKARPGSLTFATAGVASSSHLTAEKFRFAAGFDALHVPFKSTPDAFAEVLAGRVTYTFTGIASAVPFFNDGRLVPLAMGGLRRSSALPDIPTTEESIPNAGYPGWLGILVPAKTPRDIINRLH